MGVDRWGMSGFWKSKVETVKDMCASLFTLERSLGAEI